MSTQREPYLPPGFSLEEEEDFVRILFPSGRRVPDALFASTVDPRVVEEVAWERHLDAEEAVRGCERALGRPSDPVRGVSVRGGDSLWRWVEKELSATYSPEELAEKMREFSEMHLLDTMRFFGDLELRGDDASDEEGAEPGRRAV